MHRDAHCLVISTLSLVLGSMEIRQLSYYGIHESVILHRAMREGKSEGERERERKIYNFKRRATQQLSITSSCIWACQHFRELIMMTMVEKTYGVFGCTYTWNRWQCFIELNNELPWDILNEFLHTTCHCLSVLILFFFSSFLGDWEREKLYRGRDP